MTEVSEGMDVVVGLRRLHRLLEDPGHWTRRTSARDANGEDVDPQDPDACQWCLLGGVYKVADSGVADEMIRALHREWGDSLNCLSFFNDHGASHRQVVDLVTRTIASYRGGC